MNTFKKDMEKLFRTSSLNGLFNIPKTATDGDLKRAYRKLSLTVHPDRVAEADKKTATAKFQVVGKAYAILSDKQQRTIYDTYGVVDDDEVEGKVYCSFCREWQLQRNVKRHKTSTKHGRFQRAAFRKKHGS